MKRRTLVAALILALSVVAGLTVAGYPIRSRDGTYTASLQWPTSTTTSTTTKTTCGVMNALGLCPNSTTTITFQNTTRTLTG